MSAIRTIAQGNYILSTPQEVSHDNTLSGNGTVNSPLGVVPGYNETVLYSGAYNTSITSVILSEEITHFEKIEVWWIQQNARPIINQYQTENLSQMFIVHGKCENKNAVVFIAGWNKGSDNKTFTKSLCKYKPTDNWNAFVDANELIPVKIIGINRIANN